MASMVRPTLLRQAFNAAPAKRLSTQAACQLHRVNPLARRSLQPSFMREAFPQATSIAAFHATTRRPILPALPQKVEGTVNDPALVPHTSHLHGSYHWTFERYLKGCLAYSEQLLTFLGLGSSLLASFRSQSHLLLPVRSILLWMLPFALSFCFIHTLDFSKKKRSTLPRQIY